MRQRVAWGVATGLSSLVLSLLAVSALRPEEPAAVPQPRGALDLVGSNGLFGRGMNSALAVHGDHAYVGNRTDGSHPRAGVMVVDVADSAHPRVVGEIGPPDEGVPGASSRELRVWPEQDLLIVLSFACDPVGHVCLGSAAAGAPTELHLYDIAGAKAAAPERVATYRLPYLAHEFFLWVDPRDRNRALLYITTPFSEGADISREQPHLVVLDISGAREGTFRQVATWTPEREERWDEGGLHSLSVSDDGNTAYLADLEGGFSMADVSALARGDENPQIRQLTPPTATVHTESPGVHSALPLPGRPYALITDEVYGEGFGAAPVIGFNVLKGCPWGWSRLIDVRDPAAPREVGEYRVRPYNDPAECHRNSPLRQNGASFSSHNPTLSEHLAFMTWHSGGLQVASLADPAEPVRTAEFLPRPLRSVTTEDPALSTGTDKVVMWSYPIIRDGLVYVADLRNGLYVLRYRGPYADELGCRTLLEGNSNAGARVPACGLDLRLERQRCGGPGRPLALAGADRARARKLRLRRAGRGRVAGVVTTADGSRVQLPAVVNRCRR